MSSESSESAPTHAIADLPTGEPVPSSSPMPPAAAASSSSPSAKHSIRLRALLSRAPHNIDAFLAHLQRCLSTPAGIDTVLLFVCYASRLSSSLLTALAKRALHRSAAEWVALVSASRTTVVAVAGSGKPAPSAAAAASLLLAERLKNLSALLSETRTIMRLWGLLGMYSWAKRLAAESLSKQGSDRDGPKPAILATSAVAYSQLAACVVFQALENGAYLSSRGVLGWSRPTQAWAMKWSARLWGAYVGVELGKLAAEGLAAARAAGGRRPAARKEEGTGEDAAAAAAEEDATRWRNAFVRNLAWAPLTVHWGSEKGLVADWMVGALATVPGVIQMTDLWKRTA